MSVTLGYESKTYDEACKDENGKIAMNYELKTLANNGT